VLITAFIPVPNISSSDKLGVQGVRQRAHVFLGISPSGFRRPPSLSHTPYVYPPSLSFVAAFSAAVVPRRGSVRTRSRNRTLGSRGEEIPRTSLPLGLAHANQSCSSKRSCCWCARGE